jgi:hypothetical protein
VGLDLLTSTGRYGCDGSGVGHSYRGGNSWAKPKVAAAKVRVIIKCFMMDSFFSGFIVLYSHNIPSKIHQVKYIISIYLINNFYTTGFGRIYATREGSALPNTYLTLNKPPSSRSVYFRGHLAVLYEIKNRRPKPPVFQ